MRRGVPATRWWTALLLLAAVFTMHGLQCAGAPEGTEHSTAAMAAMHPADAVPEMIGAAVAVVTDHGTVPHDAAAHLWTVCLAVLAVGLVCLLAGLVGRRTGGKPPAALLLRSRRRGRRPPLRPPDLHALCILRT